jgi:two-component system response regulator NreC
VRAAPADRDQATIVAADDHTVVRQGLRMLIEAESGIRLIVEADDVCDAERLTRAHRTRVLVLDLEHSHRACPSPASRPSVARRPPA